MSLALIHGLLSQMHGFFHLVAWPAKSLPLRAQAVQGNLSCSAFFRDDSGCTDPSKWVCSKLKHGKTHSECCPFVV